MNPVIFDHIPFELAADDIAPQLHIEKGTEDYDALTALVAEACTVARPKVLFTTASITDRGLDFVELNGVRMLSRIMPVNFTHVQRVYPYVATCGTEVDQWSSGITDFLQSWWMDVAKAHLLGKAISHLNKHLVNDLMLGKFSNMNPGSLPDWPITEQVKLFSLLGNVKAQIGVTLTDSMLMLPTKSVSGVYFQTDSNYENCQLCTRKDCPSRRKPFDGTMYLEMTCT